MNRYLRSIVVVLSLFVCLVADAQGYPVRKVSVGEGKNYVSSAEHKVSRTFDEGGDWKLLGTGKLRDDILTTLYIVDNYEFEVKIQESISTPGIYRIVSPYKNYPVSPAVFEGDTYLEINATEPDKVYFKKYDTGMDWGEGSMIISSVAGDYVERYGDLSQAVSEGMCGTLKDGAITFPKGALLVQNNSMGEDQYMFANKNGKFRILLPGAPDLDIDIDIADNLVEKDGEQFVSVDFTVGNDVEKFKVVMVKGEYSQELVDGIVDGSVPSEEMTQSGTCLLPLDEDGIYTICAVPYYNGEIRSAVYLTKEFSFLHEGWKNLGTAQYTDGYLADSEVDMGIEVVTTSVEIQESTEKPGLFRLVNPYGLNYAYSNEQNYDTSRNYYMEVDASDPNRVVINDMPDGCGLVFNVGKMELWSRAGKYLADGKTQEEIEEMNLYGKRENNTVTFPDGALLIRFFEVTDSWYRCNRNGYFKLVLPESAGICKPVADEYEHVKPEYFTIGGVKVNASALKPGLYIRMQGSKSSKIVIR